MTAWNLTDHSPVLRLGFSAVSRRICRTPGIFSFRHSLNGISAKKNPGGIEGPAGVFNETCLSANHEEALDSCPLFNVGRTVVQERQRVKKFLSRSSNRSASHRINVFLVRKNVSLDTESLSPEHRRRFTKQHHS